MEKFVLFTPKMKFLPKNVTQLYKLGIKTGIWYPKMYIWSLKMENFCTFYTKNEIFGQNFHPIVQIGDKPIVQIGDKNWTLVPQNVHLVIKNGKICTFYTKN